MRILQLNDYGVRLGGAEQYYFAISAELRRQGHEVLTVSSNHQRDSRLIESDCQLTESGHCFNIDHLFNPLAYYQLKQILRAFRPNVVHAHNLFYRLSPSVAFACSNIASCLTLHDYQAICFGDKRLTNGSICTAAFNCCSEGCHSRQLSLFDRLRLRLSQAALKRMDLLIAPSQYVESEFRRNAFDAIRHIPHPRAYADTVVDSDSLRQDFVYVGRLAEQKGLQFLLDAFLSLEPSVPCLHLIGDGPERANLELKVKQAQAQERVVFHGYLDASQRAAVVKKCIATVIPSLWPENSPLVIPESSLLATPCIVSQVGGLPELVRDQETGVVVKPANVEALKEALSSAQNNTDLMRMMGRKAQAEAQSYSLEQHVKELLDTYSQL